MHMYGHMYGHSWSNLNTQVPTIQPPTATRIGMNNTNQPGDRLTNLGGGVERGGHARRRGPDGVRRDARALLAWMAPGRAEDKGVGGRGNGSAALRDVAAGRAGVGTWACPGAARRSSTRSALQLVIHNNDPQAYVRIMAGLSKSKSPARWACGLAAACCRAKGEVHCRTHASPTEHPPSTPCTHNSPHRRRLRSRAASTCNASCHVYARTRTHVCVCTRVPHMYTRTGGAPVANTASITSSSGLLMAQGTLPRQVRPSHSGCSAPLPSTASRLCSSCGGTTACRMCVQQCHMTRCPRFFRCAVRNTCSKRCVGWVGRLGA